MAKRVFITGSNGFIGSNLTAYLRGQGHEVFASTQDILQVQNLAGEVRSFRPQCLIHLAAISHAKTCEQDPHLAREVNEVGTSNVLSLAGEVSELEKVIFASTAQVYRPATDREAVLTESSELGPINYYAETKLQGEMLVRQFSEKTQKKSIIFRIFNHVHRSQAAGTYFLASVYQDLLNCPEGGKVSVGNLDLYRDMGAILDLLRAFACAVEAESFGQGLSEVYNICNGEPRLLRDLANELAVRLRKKCDFVVDEKRLRKVDPLTLIGSHQKFKKALGWTPQVKTNSELLDAFLAEKIYVGT